MYSLLWPLADHWPAPAVEAVLAQLLGTGSALQLRATCRAARAAVDSRTKSIELRGRDCAATLAGLTPARFPSVVQLECTNIAPAENCAPLEAALRALAPQLEALELSSGRGEEPLPASLAAAIAACTRLARLDCSVGGAAGAFVEAGQLPALTRLRFEFESGIRPNNEDLEWEPELCGRLPLEQLEEVTLHGASPVCIALVRELASRNSLPKLRSLSAEVAGPRTAAAIWAAPWLTQLTQLELMHPDNAGCLLHGRFESGLDLPLLQSLNMEPLVHPCLGDEITIEDARRLAACRLPALRTLGFESPEPGAAEALLSAPWAAGLEDLRISARRAVLTPASAAALRGAPLSRLQSLRLWLDLPNRTMDDWFGEQQQEGAEADARANEEAASLLGSVLSAPWAASMHTLDLRGAFVQRAAAAAPLPGLRALTFANKVEVIDIARLSRAQWLPNLEQLLIHSYQGGPGAAGVFALAALRMPRLLTFDLDCYASNFGGEEGMAFLAAAPWLRGLQRLVLRGPPMANMGWCKAALEDPAGPFQALKRSGAIVRAWDVEL